MLAGHPALYPYRRRAGYGAASVSIRRRRRIARRHSPARDRFRGVSLLPSGSGTGSRRPRRVEGAVLRMHYVWTHRATPSSAARRDLFSSNHAAPRSIIASIVQRQAFDAVYVQRLAQSDHETERDFAAYFGELLAIKLRSRLRSQDLIEDVIQETFVRVLKTLRYSGIDNPGALGSFVNSTCNNVLFELYRQQSRLSGPPEDRASSDIPIQTRIEGEQEQSEVRHVLAELPEKDRTILRLLFFEERDKTEVCRTLGVDREYLRVLLHRAKTRFRADWVKRLATKVNRVSPIG